MKVSTTASIDFTHPGSNKRLKYEHVPFSQYISAFVNPFSFLAMQTSVKERQASSKKYADELDSILTQLQDLTVDSPAEKENDIIDEELFNVKRQIIKGRSQDIDTSEFDELFEQTKPTTLKETVKPLTDIENKIVDDALTRKQSGTASQFKKVTVNYKDIQRLKPETWLNDEIINFYFELLSERQTREGFPSIHCFNSFFCSTLRDQGYAKVQRWTKRVDIFAKELIFIPINQSYHWTLGVIDMKRKAVTVYDSMGGNHNHSLKLFIDYLQQEHLDKKKTPLNISDWKLETPKDIPRQGNMSDCGAFTCTFAERLSRNESFNFSQQDMVPIRRRMVLDILNKTI